LWRGGRRFRHRGNLGVTFKGASAPAALIGKTGRESKENIGDFAGRRRPKAWLIRRLLDEKAVWD
jgi:hypothetical protein